MLMFLTLAGCGKHNVAVKHGDAGDDAIAAMARADLETPFFLALSKAISAEQVDKNGSLNAVLATTTNEFEANGFCRAPKSSIALLPNGGWMVARIAQAIEGRALIRRGREYQIVSSIPVTNLIRAQGWMCPGWYYFEWGHFSLKKIERVNEFTAPDPQTMATTKVRSYRLSAVFVPGAALAKAAPHAEYGTFTWIAAFEQDPVSLNWKLYKFDKGIHWSP